LARHGYHVYPQGPYFAPRRDGRYLQLPSDPASRREQIAKFSDKDADAFERWTEWFDSVASILGPLLAEIPPRIGSRRPVDLARQARLLTRLRDIDERRAVDITRLLTMSIADLVEDFFVSDAVQAAASVSGVIGTWAGPRSAGTAYVMAHHHIGDLGDGRLGAWGFPRGGMGGVTQALASAARSFGAQIRTAAPVARIETAGDAVTGVVLESGEQLSAPVVVSTAHPQIAFLRLLDRQALPADFVADIERWRTRSGTVKINVALDRSPEFASKPGLDPQVHGGTIVLAESVDDIEGAYQEAVNGRPASLPFADICIPSVFDDSLAPKGRQVMSMFTQWVPHTWNSEPHRGELETYADRVFARMDDVAPGFTDSVLHRTVIGPYEMEHEYNLIGGNIFHGELTPAQMFHARPAAGYADLRTPVRGLYQAGSATHGGGGVTGIPGRNVVRQILADRRRANRGAAWPAALRDLVRR
nr:NAD(P)/FAD-dependent oxidoreductase [Acidothermales bacterium]